VHKISRREVFIDKRQLKREVKVKVPHVRCIPNKINKKEIKTNRNKIKEKQLLTGNFL